MKVYIVGAGLAGSEISLQLAERNYEVVLFEQRKEKNTGVFKTPFFAEGGFFRSDRDGRGSGSWHES